MNEGKVSGENISRMGMLHFKNDKLPDTKALLRIHDVHIDITIVWNPSDSTFERCFFSEHVFYADDPDRKKMFMIYLNKSGFVILKDQWICSVAKSDHARKNTGRVLTGSLTRSMQCLMLRWGKTIQESMQYVLL